ncbi:hypothetical protein HNR12_002197 [Streptomonospora nanhaiensis]|uniref:Uncharacterized protein n=1 Tax=Streptomonospora nanhaiensis TaxID=1323731 RepID=A0A853BLQ2_9ACTN|nr:hypothetical protein [Streptomonospora nanhaiensis]
MLALSPPGRLSHCVYAKETCSYCGAEALLITYPCGPDLPVPVCGKCAGR